MTSLRVLAAVLAASFLIVAPGANADPAKTERMPAKPQFGAPSDDPMPPVQTGAVRRQPGGLKAARLGGSLRAALAAPDDVATRGNTEQKLYEKFGRSVVLIVLPDSLGSGAVINKDGTIITNYHVVEGFKSAGVIFKPKAAGANPRTAEAVEAEVLYVDEVADLALIKVASLPKDVTPLALGDIRNLKIGADVQAIGHPIGESWSFTKGIISQIRPDFEWRYESGPQHRGDVIQTQTPINPGNSGGPLLNNAGEIVGLNTFGNNQAQGINFAVAVTEIRRFVALRANRRAPDTLAIDESMPNAPLPAAQNAPPTCKAAKLETRRAERQQATGHLLDTDCDGTVDAILIVPDNRREPIMLLMDANQNQTIDAVYVDEDRDLKFDYVLFDTDEDGNSDMMGVDLDQDLKPARFLASRT